MISYGVLGSGIGIAAGIIALIYWAITHSSSGDFTSTGEAVSEARTYAMHGNVAGMQNTEAGQRNAATHAGMQASAEARRGSAEARVALASERHANAIVATVKSNVQGKGAESNPQEILAELAKAIAKLSEERGAIEKIESIIAKIAGLEQTIVKRMQAADIIARSINEKLKHEHPLVVGSPNLTAFEKKVNGTIKADHEELVRIAESIQAAKIAVAGIVAKFQEQGARIIEMQRHAQNLQDENARFSMIRAAEAFEANSVEIDRWLADFDSRMATIEAHETNMRQHSSWFEEFERQMAHDVEVQRQRAAHAASNIIAVHGR